ncbi:MAG: NAD-dependent epimerase/dehydratase family protein [Acidimicrobiales bacterium]
MRVLVTGGLGYIGGEVVRRLLQRGDEVSVIDLARRPATAPPPPHDNMTVHFANITKPEKIRPLFDDVDAVVHAAGIHHADEVARQPNRHVNVNVGGTLNVLRAAEQAGVRRVVQLSSAKVYGQTEVASTESDLVRPTDEYALGKCVAEAYCAHFAANTTLEVTSLRPFSVYGPGMDLRTGYCGALLDAVVTGAPAVLSGTPDFSRDFVHLDTVADVIVAASTSAVPPPLLLNVGSGRSTTLSELVEVFDDLTCRRLAATYSTPRGGTLERTLADISLMNDVACPEIPDLRTGVEAMIRSHFTNR